MEIIQYKLRPILKWAGGKSRIYKHLKMPISLSEGRIKNYYEPFFGGGAVFFNLIQSFKFEKCIISDINEDLILFYNVVRKNPLKFIDFSEKYFEIYNHLSSNDEKKKFYEEIRNTYNIDRFNIDYESYSESHIPRAAQMLFLNKTCWGGLYRQNVSGEFNTPCAEYNPSKLKKTHIMNVSNVLKNVEIICSDFQHVCERIAGNDTFVYLDPPYKDQFSEYYKTHFSDKDQERLSEVFKELHNKGVFLMMNNSYSDEDKAIEKLYKGFNIDYIDSVSTIANDPSKRKEIKELLITNY